MIRTARIGAVLAVAMGFAHPAPAEETLATFALDSFSFVSFEDEDVYPIPSGGELRFRFASPSADGSLAFTLQPGDVALPPIPVGQGRTLSYRLMSATSGVARKNGDGNLVVQFPATVTATLSTPEGPASTQYSLLFTTESASAQDLARVETVSVEGMRLSPSARAMQLVGATTSKEGATPGPGKAAYTVLSGRFDRLPAPP